MSDRVPGARVLLIEDNEGDYILTKESLAQRPDLGFTLDWIASPDEGLSALIENRHDICLVDYRLGPTSGLDVVRQAQACGSEVPIIVLTGDHDPRIDTEAIEAGASDYLIKRNLLGDELLRSIRYALAQRSVEDKLRLAARTDQLTGLANRCEFVNALELALARSGRGAKSFAVLYLDLDGFKLVNDTMGHALGDLLLQQASQRLQSCLRSIDLVARIGGDEFTILALDVERPRDCVAIAEKILAELDAPFSLGDQDANVSASVGIAMFPQGGCDADTLMSNADAAMYRAKKDGGGRFQFHSHAITKAARARSRMERELRDAIDSRRLSLVYQPQVLIDTGEIVGFEALVRWTHPSLGTVPPSDFIPVAEEMGRIKDLGAWVMRRAAEDHVQLQQLEGGGLSVSVNVSPIELNDSGFPETLRRILGETGYNPNNLVLELTETAIIGDVAVVRANLSRLREMGVRVCVDDFGIGYSGLSQLRDLPLDALKIDKSFIAKLLEGPKEVAITHAIIDLAKRFRLDVVAEGVENSEQVNALMELGCRFAQGYHFYRPMPLSAISELCADGPAAGEIALKRVAGQR